MFRFPYTTVFFPNPTIVSGNCLYYDTPIPERFINHVIAQQNKYQLLSQQGGKMIQINGQDQQEVMELIYKQLVNM